jgi:hypothetical protein
MTVREMGVVMHGTGALQDLLLSQVPQLGGTHNLERVTGGEINLQMTDAPTMPGKVLIAVIERWPGGEIKVLWAGWATNERDAFALALPHYEMIKSARKAG